MDRIVDVANLKIVPTKKKGTGVTKYLWVPEKIAYFVEWLRQKKGFPTWSMTMVWLITGYSKLYQPAMEEFLIQEAKKRGISTEDLLAVTVDISRDFMVGRIIEGELINAN